VDLAVMVESVVMVEMEGLVSHSCDNRSMSCSNALSSKTPNTYPSSSAERKKRSQKVGDLCMWVLVMAAMVDVDRVHCSESLGS
jgi:hypothetical protein